MSCPLILERGAIALTTCTRRHGYTCLDCLETIKQGDEMAPTSLGGGGELPGFRCTRCARSLYDRLPRCPTCEMKFDPDDHRRARVHNNVEYCSDRCVLTVRERNVAELRGLLSRHGAEHAPHRRMRQGQP